MLPLLTFRAAWLAAASLGAGGINAVAGGGSLLSFPSLIQIGVAPVQANATNTVALLPGQYTSAAAYRRELARHHSLLLPVVIAAFVGGLLGARMLMATKQDQFLLLVPWLLLTATLLFALGPALQKRLLGNRVRAKHPTRLRRALLAAGVFCVCLYIGFFGAGAGLLMMSVLSVAGIESVHEINALKTVITSVSNSVATLTFILYGAVLWHYCLLMMVAASIGGYVVAHFARKRQPRGIRIFVVVLGTVVSTYFFWKIY